MPILNPGFEAAGIGGAAQDWTTTITFTGALIADFSGGGAMAPRPVEDFEAGWPVGMIYVEKVDTGQPMIFDLATTPTAALAESFESWAGGAYLTSIGTGVALLFGTAQLATAEAFDDGWPVEGAPYVTTVSGGPSFTEDFESGWNGGDPYVTEVSSGTAATFDQGSKTAEDFEAIQADLVFVVDDVLDTCTTSAPHSLPNGFLVTTLATGRRADGLVEGQVYQLVSASGSTFQLAKPPSSTPINLLDAGIGVQSIHADESLFWTITL